MTLMFFLSWKVRVKLDHPYLPTINALNYKDMAEHGESMLCERQQHREHEIHRFSIGVTEWGSRRATQD